MTLAQTEKGWDVLDASLIQSGNTGLADTLNVLEALLCFDAWLNQDKFWSLNNAPEEEHKALASIQELMSMCQCCFPDELHTIKFHLLVHFPYFITKFGAPKNFDSQRPENSHIQHAKRPGRRAHKTHHAQDFEKQVAHRLADSIVVEYLHQKICISSQSLSIAGAKPPASCLSCSTTRGAICLLHCQPDRRVKQTWSTTADASRNSHGLPRGSSSFLMAYFACTNLMTCTEVVVRHVLYRCHPNYRNRGPWFDWAIVQLYRNQCPKPCKLLAVIPTASNSDMHNTTLTEPWVLVAPCSDRTGSASILFTEWMLSRSMLVVPASNIIRPCLTIVLDSSKVCVAKHIEKWPKEFS